MITGVLAYINKAALATASRPKFSVTWCFTDGACSPHGQTACQALRHSLGLIYPLEKGLVVGQALGEPEVDLALGALHRVRACSRGASGIKIACSG